MAFVVGSECKEMMMRDDEKGKREKRKLWKMENFLLSRAPKSNERCFPTLFCSQSFPSNDHERMCCRGNFKLCNQNFDKDFISEKKLYRKVEGGSRNLAKK